jgi:hypothetical protein
MFKEMKMIKDLISKIKTDLKKYVILTGLVLLGLFGFKACRKVQQKADQVATNPVLKPTEAEKIIINAPEHKITVVTPQGSTTTNFSDNSVITEDKTGKLNIYNPSWNFKLHPTVGAGFSNRPKLFVGVSPIGYKKLDLNIGLETDCQHFSETAMNVSVGYNVHNATYLFLGVNNHRDIEGGVRFRF